MIAYLALALTIAVNAATLVMLVRGARVLRRLDPQRPATTTPDDDLARLDAYTARAFANARGDEAPASWGTRHDDAPPPSTWGGWSASAHNDAPPPPRDW